MEYLVLYKTPGFPNIATHRPGFGVLFFDALRVPPSTLTTSTASET